MTRSPPPTPGSLLSVDGLTLTAGRRVLVQQLSFELAPGDRLVVVGGNGSGKSTLLAILAGLAEPAAGQVRRPATPPGVLFQDGALWPHMTVAQHLAFVDADDRPDWRRRLLATFDLESLADHRPEALSGGERLRLGIARALAGRPGWVLLDEPLAHLDPAAAARVREALPPLLDELSAAAITVTHDADDVQLFGDRLLALDGQGGWWFGPARFALESCPTATLAAFSARGTLLSAVADASGQADFGLGLTLTGYPPGRSAQAFLDAAAVCIGTQADHDVLARYVAPDRRGGSWFRVDGRLLRCAECRGAMMAGDEVPLRIVGQPRQLDVEAPA